ncbi:hypothetical protein [uncultured Pseudodesulfovibrio sp.]|uniref:hypothetical protein n=1 Tax=uncultured Pseudodesulfovibrio sp. TaxID=2035858 RepID=UPI0029C96A18|nr:hypothetical protein [uncultured Pseudodesulfovibrio sp.]
MRILKIGIRKSNWEVLAFVLFNHFATTIGRDFSRSQLMTSSNLEYIVRSLCRFKHKKDMEQAEASLQKAIQELRDDGYLLFHGHGDYFLTDEGIIESKRVMKELNATSLAEAEKQLEAIANKKEEEYLTMVADYFTNLPPDKQLEILARINYGDR